jgi:SDR family mycofactocin-dependent oxidoreductase
MTRVALVTGAARGIGAATVRALAADGWSVVATDRGEDDPRLPYALGTEDELRAVTADAEGETEAVVADSANLDAMTTAVGVAEERFGGLDALVAAAGVFAGGVPSWELAQEQEDAIYEADLHGVAVAARAGIPALLRRPEPRRGSFLAVSSAAAGKGLKYVAAYSAAKAGVEGMVRGLATDLGGTGITANAIRPGSTETPILAESARVYGVDPLEFKEHQPALGRLIRAEEVADAIVFLAGPGGAAITGGVIPVDGGMAL